MKRVRVCWPITNMLYFALTVVPCSTFCPAVQCGTMSRLTSDENIPSCMRARRSPLILTPGLVSFNRSASWRCGVCVCGRGGSQGVKPGNQYFLNVFMIP